MQLQIHQFSLGLQINTNRQGHYVSGGFYGQTIDHPSSQVPQDIKQAVEGDLFKIPDGYPPEPGQLALIAREVGQYCVLAVANILDDFSDRNLVGYRYFWLDTQELSPDDDGIATLLLKWYQNNQPCLNLQELQENSSLYTNSWTQVQDCPKQQFVEQYQSLVQHLYSEIAGKPTPLFLIKQKLPEITFAHLHCLAIEHQRQTGKPISWAWNVRRLSVFELPNKEQDYPPALKRCQSFQLIYCPDQKDVEWLNKQLNKLAQASNEEPGKTNGENPQLASITPQVFTRKLGQLDISWAIVKELADFYQDNPSQLNKDNLEQDCLNQFNKENTNHASYENFVRYVTIFVALTPILKKEKQRLLGLENEYKQKAIEHLNNVINLVPKQSADKNQYRKFISALEQLLQQMEKPSDNHWEFFIKIIFPILATVVGLSALGLYFFLWPSSKEQNGHLGIFSNLPFLRSAPTTKETVGKEAGETTNEGNPQTKLAVFLNMYEGIFNDVEIGKKNQLEQSDFFKSFSTTLQASRADIRKILDDNQQLLTDLKDKKSEVVQKARKEDIYNQLKLFTTLNSAKIEEALPKLEKGVEDPLSVAMLQEALKRGSNYYLADQKDLPGIFGEATKNAVIQAQTQAKFPNGEKEGIVGPKTWRDILKDRIQDLQLEAVYQTLQTHLSQPNPTTSNIVTEIKKCQDKHNKEKNPLHFNDCLKKIGKSTNQSAQGANSGSQNPQNTQVR